MTRDPKLGHVVVLTGVGEPAVYDNQPGVVYSVNPGERIRALDPLDGPIRLEQWGAGGGIAFEGKSVEDDPTAEPSSSGGTHLYGLLPDGTRVFTAPLEDIQRWVPNGTPFATVVDGLVFELGTPDPDWLAASSETSPEETLDIFIRSFAPLSLEPLQ